MKFVSLYSIERHAAFLRMSLSTVRNRHIYPQYGLISVRCAHKPCKHNVREVVRPLSTDAAQFSNPPYFETPTIILAGFPLEELAMCRTILDQAGGHDIIMVPCRSDLLHHPVHNALKLGEPAWHEPMPSDWVDGGGWGKVRTLLFYKIDHLSQNVICEVLEDAFGKIQRAEFCLQETERILGDMLAAAQKQRRAQMEADVEFVDELPEVEEMLCSELLQQSESAEMIANSMQDEFEFDLIDRIAKM